VVRKTDQKVIVLFDGICNLCNGAVRFLIQRDKRNVFLFASLQSDAAQKLLKQHGLNPDVFDSIVVIDQGHVYERSDAALKIASYMGRFWSSFAIFKFLPRFFRDGIYNIVARSRYSVFGKRAECMIPTPELKDRFLFLLFPVLFL
jgi:predicted DCC family thiol-disulfide oxidoreductase YuxK